MSDVSVRQHHRGTAGGTGTAGVTVALAPAAPSLPLLVLLVVTVSRDTQAVLLLVGCEA